MSKVVIYLLIAAAGLVIVGMTWYFWGDLRKAFKKLKEARDSRLE